MLLFTCRRDEAVRGEVAVSTPDRPLEFHGVQASPGRASKDIAIYEARRSVSPRLGNVRLEQRLSALQCPSSSCPQKFGQRKFKMSEDYCFWRAASFQPRALASRLRFAAWSM